MSIILIISEISCCAIGSKVPVLNVLPELHFEGVWHRCPRSVILRHRHFVAHLIRDAAIMSAEDLLPW